jgi:hypothetical protein
MSRWPVIAVSTIPSILSILGQTRWVDLFKEGVEILCGLTCEGVICYFSTLNGRENKQPKASLIHRYNSRKICMIFIHNILLARPIACLPSLIIRDPFKPSNNFQRSEEKNVHKTQF